MQLNRMYRTCRSETESILSILFILSPVCVVAVGAALGLFRVRTATALPPSPRVRRAVRGSSRTRYAAGSPR
jgi:hypothetical protein